MLVTIIIVSLPSSKSFRIDSFLDHLLLHCAEVLIKLFNYPAATTQLLPKIKNFDKYEENSPYKFP